MTAVESIDRFAERGAPLAITVLRTKKTAAATIVARKSTAKFALPGGSKNAHKSVTRRLLRRSPAESRQHDLRGCRTKGCVHEPHGFRSFRSPQPIHRRPGPRVPSPRRSEPLRRLGVCPCGSSNGQCRRDQREDGPEGDAERISDVLGCGAPIAASRGAVQFLAPAGNRKVATTSAIALRVTTPAI